MMRKTAPFLGLALALILASCGGGNNSSASDSSVEESTGEASSSENASSSSSSADEEHSSDSSSSSNEATEVVTSWERNRAYLNYLSRSYQVSSDLGSSDFMSRHGLFRIGNMNEVSLAPTVTVLDLITMAPSTYSGMPDGADVRIFDTEGNALNLSDYFDEVALSRLKSEGLVFFRKDLASSLPRDVVLTFELEGTLLSSLEHRVHIEDGAYNVTRAKELVLFDNAHEDESYLAMKEEVIGAEATAATSYDKLVIYGDIVIEKDDIPSSLLWSEADEKADPAVYGTLKDWNYVYKHEPGEEADYQAAIYGNYNQISLGETFPYVVSEARSNGTPTLPDASTGAISTHAALFGNDTGLSPEQTYEISFVDLAVYGNQGVSSDQVEDWKLTPDDPSDDTLAGGILFAKQSGKMSFENCRIQHFFTVLVNNGPSSVNELLKRGGHRPEVHIKETRMSDCFSSMLFNYSDALIEVENSILEKAGGFLFINQAIPTAADPAVSDKWADLEDKGASQYLKGSDIIVDNVTRLSNYVTGQGGWFDLYGLGPLFQSVLKPMASDTLHDLGKTLFQSVDGAERINAVALTMNCDMEAAGELEPGMDATVSIGECAYTDYRNGEEAFKKALSSFDPSNPLSSLASLLPVLNGTHYGAGFLTSYLTASMMTYDQEGAPYFFAPFTLTPDDFASYRAVDLTSLITTIFTGGDLTKIAGADASKLNHEYLGLSYLYGAKAQLPGGIESSVADAMAYEGSAAYSVVFGLNDYAAQ